MKVLEISGGALYLFSKNSNREYCNIACSSEKIQKFVKNSQDTRLIVLSSAMDFETAEILQTIFPEIKISFYLKTEKFGGIKRGDAPVHFGEKKMATIISIPKNIKCYVSSSWGYEVFGKGENGISNAKKLGVKKCPIEWDIDMLQATAQ